MTRVAALERRLGELGSMGWRQAYAAEAGSVSLSPGSYPSGDVESTDSGPELTIYLPSTQFVEFMAEVQVQSNADNAGRPNAVAGFSIAASGGGGQYRSGLFAPPPNSVATSGNIFYLVSSSPGAWWYYDAGNFQYGGAGGPGGDAGFLAREFPAGTYTFSLEYERSTTMTNTYSNRKLWLRY